MPFSVMQGEASDLTGQAKRAIVWRGNRHDTVPPLDGVTDSHRIVANIKTHAYI